MKHPFACSTSELEALTAREIAEVSGGWIPGPGCYPPCPPYPPPFPPPPPYYPPFPPSNPYGEGGYPPSDPWREGGHFPTRMLGEDGGGYPPVTHMMGEDGHGLPPGASGPR